MKKQTSRETGSACPCELSEFCQGQSDQEIVEYVKEDKECYRLLIERYDDKLTRYVRRISGVPAESIEDIVQDVFMKVYINLNSYDPEKSFSSWIYRIAHNETINFWRKNKKKNESTVSLESEAALGNMPDGRDMEREVFGRINGGEVLGALQNVDQKYKDAITLSYIQGATYREIAARIGSPIGTVGTLINRGKKVLRAHLEQKGFSSQSLAEVK